GSQSSARWPGGGLVGARSGRIGQQRDGGVSVSPELGRPGRNTGAGVDYSGDRLSAITRAGTRDRSGWRAPDERDSGEPVGLDGHQWRGYWLCGDELYHDRDAPEHDRNGGP